MMQLLIQKRLLPADEHGLQSSELYRLSCFEDSFAILDTAATKSQIRYRLKVTIYDKNGKFTIFIFSHKNKRFLGIF